MVETYPRLGKGLVAICPNRMNWYQTTPMKILIVEDDQAVSDSLKIGLERAGHTCGLAKTGAEALDLVSEGFEIVTLDLGLPDMDGQDLCKLLRAKTDIPIVVLSARDQEIDRVIALELGADDYLVKPYGLNELLARIRAVHRRTSSKNLELLESETTVVGGLEIDQRAQTVKLNGREIHLTPTEFQLLVYLASDPGRVMSRSDILRNVWDGEWFGSTKTLDAHVASIRKKFGSADWVISVRGVGFKLGNIDA